MDVFHGFAEARGHLDGCAVALGNFDGVHLGHQALLGWARDEARRRGQPSVAATFDPHPGKVLTPELAPKLISPLWRRLELLEDFGLDAVILQPFDRPYAALDATQFLSRDLFGLLPSELVVGSDFTYGKSRFGNVESLREACESGAVSPPALRARGGVRLTVIAPITCDGVVVSSSKIREFVAEGRVAAAARLLGRPFELSGEVVSGMGRGRGIGFPTANLASENEVRPAIGVYAVRASLEGRVLFGAANIGRKPTFGDAEVTIEVHLFDFEGDLYGKTLAVEFLDRLRGEQRFAGVAALKAQIARDCEKAREIARETPPPGPLAPQASRRRGP